MTIVPSFGHPRSTTGTTYLKNVHTASNLWKPHPLNAGDPMKGVSEPSVEDFTSYITSRKRPIAMVLYSPKCSWCKKLAPVIERLGAITRQQKSRIELAKFDVTQEGAPNYKEKYRVYGLPQIIFFSGDHNNDEPIALPNPPLWRTIWHGSTTRVVARVLKFFNDQIPDKEALEDTVDDNIEVLSVAEEDRLLAEQRATETQAAEQAAKEAEAQAQQEREAAFQAAEEAAAAEDARIQGHTDHSHGVGAGHIKDAEGNTVSVGGDEHHHHGHTHAQPQSDTATSTEQDTTTTTTTGTEEQAPPQEDQGPQLGDAQPEGDGNNQTPPAEGGETAAPTEEKPVTTEESATPPPTDGNEAADSAQATDAAATQQTATEDSAAAAQEQQPPAEPKQEEKAPPADFTPFDPDADTPPPPKPKKRKNKKKKKASLKSSTTTDSFAL